MKKITTITILLLILALPSFAETGLGIVAGHPTGASGILYLNKSNSIDAVAAWSFINGNHLYLHTDYQIYLNNIINIESEDLPLYFGLGAAAEINGGFSFGIRLPLGIKYNFKNIPIEIFMEIAPVFKLYPATKFSFYGGLGFHYIFN